MSVLQVRTFPAPPFCEREALRYAGCREADTMMRDMLAACYKEVCGKLCYRVCFGEYPMTIHENVCDFGTFTVSSRALAESLAGCTSALVFGATIGIEADRLIAKYGRLSPTKALLLQAIGAERIEALCDAFCAVYEEENSVRLTARFSPGYRDLALESQRDLFAVLDLPRKIGLTLNSSLLMSPTKSVTAIAGVRADAPAECRAKCARCDKTDCIFRSDIL